MRKKIRLMTIEKKPDQTYGMSYPYEKCIVDGVAVLEKLPFSPYIGRVSRNEITYFISIGNIEPFGHGKFSVRVFKYTDGKEEGLLFSDDKSLQTVFDAYNMAMDYIESRKGL